MTELNAAKQDKTAGMKLVAATGSIIRKDLSSVIGGYTNFDTTNRFTYYQQLATCTPHVSTSLNKLGLSIVKGMQFHGSSSRVVKEFELWSQKSNFIEQIQTMARLLCRDGIYVSVPMSRDPDKFRLSPLLMSSTTLLPSGITYGKTSDTIMQPPINEIVVNESDQKKRISLKPEEVIFGTYNAWDSIQEDILKRQTFGIYGSSLLDPIELSIRNLLNINFGYVSFVKKYGNGRYLFDFKMLESLVEQEIITPEAAQEAIDAFLEKHKSLSENEDIAAVGLQVTPIDAKGSLNVLDFKKSLEADIQVGLLQTPLSMGQTAGSTYAAGYVSEEDRMVVLEGLQKIVQNIANDAINKRLSMQNKTQDSVWIEFEELSRVKLDASAVQEMYNTGVITKAQFLSWAGFQEGDTGE